MKSPEQVVAEIGTRLRNRWHLGVAGLDPDGWPYRAALGQPTKPQLEADFPTARRWALDWAAWADHQGLVLVRQTRRVIGTSQTLPTHLEIPDLDTAARLVGQEWPAILRTAYDRATVLTTAFPYVDLVKTLPAVRALTDVDFTLLLDAARWFSRHDARGLTPRQVPIEGLHGKWLNRHHALIRHLSGKDDLGLISRPTRVHFTYLDPTYRALGRRWHESVTIGDPVTPAYTPDTILVLENKDTAVYFPPLPGGIAVEGEGSKAPGALPRVSWIRDCPRIIYWGDIDAAGFEIVNNLRTNGVDIQTILMDQQAYDAYERFGAWTDEKGKPIPCSPRKPLPTLTASERALYEQITDPTWARVRRVEQERIPLAEGLATVTAHLQNAVSLSPERRELQLP
ncbi:Wadjet anti-phage system protein JetD domain-containing protein [Micromonospora sp. HUAS YX12]|uniref:Wadjet anti-phage system protein JetD domain-containing protein n=1 Tax=Micromonospora sp. HUAS YX12 TaxID=3156396 RepID=A0AAU7QUG9_9ACTN